MAFADKYCTRVLNFSKVGQCEAALLMIQLISHFITRVKIGGRMGNLSERILGFC